MPEKVLGQAERVKSSEKEEAQGAEEAGGAYQVKKARDEQAAGK